jgi:hypothetical protein
MFLKISNARNSDVGLLLKTKQGYTVRKMEKLNGCIIYIDKCRFEIQKQKPSGMV